MPSPHTRTGRRGGPGARRGFTVVELIVVVGIITVLAALLLPALGGARRRAAQLEETNDIRGLGVAWLSYAKDHRDAALPGYLAPEVQQPATEGAPSWRVRYEFPDGRQIPAEHAATWVYRLGVYLDSLEDTLLRYRTLDVRDELAAQQSLDTTNPIVDPAYNEADPVGLYTAATRRIETLTLQPAFGYNAYYLGGWYDTPGLNEDPRPRFDDLRGLNSEGSPVGQKRRSWVSKRASSVRNASRMVSFCSSTAVGGTGAIQTRNLERERPGVHYVVPRFVGQEQVWVRGTLGSVFGVENSPTDTTLIVGGTAFDEAWAPVPFARWTDRPTVLHVDGHIGDVIVGDLDEMTYWIDAAERPGRPVHENQF